RVQTPHRRHGSPRVCTRHVTQFLPVEWRRHHPWLVSEACESSAHPRQFLRLHQNRQTRGETLPYLPSPCTALAVTPAPANAISSSSCGLFPLAPMAPITLPSTVSRTRR